MCLNFKTTTKMKHEDKRKSLYVATHDYTTLTKVGVAINPLARLAQLKAQSGAELQIYYESPLIENFLKVEAEVLNHFRDKRVCGEWINETPEKIIDYIKTIQNNFSTIEYACLSCLYENYTGEEIREVIKYRLKDIVLNYTQYNKGDYNIYITEDFKFNVFIRQANIVHQTEFNVYRTARKFAIEYKDRVVLIDEKTGKLINNPKFRIEND